MTIMRKAKKALSFVLLLKSIVGFSVASLALFGVSVPYIGVEPTVFHEGLAAGFGGIVGAIVAIKA